MTETGNETETETETGTTAGTGSQRQADQALALRKRRDAAALLPLVGLALLCPPVAQIFAIEGTVLGIPVTVAYVFLVWAGLILGAGLLARGLRVEEAEAEPTDG